MTRGRKPLPRETLALRDTLRKDRDRPASVIGEAIQPEADASKMEQPDMNIEWFRLAEDYTMHLDFSYCKTCDWMLHIWKKGYGANGEDLIIFNEQDTNPNLLLAKGENALKKWLRDNNINAALTPR